MSDVGKTNIVVMWTVGPDDVAEGDRIFESHVDWMTGHPRDGDAALLSYKISKGPERSNPVDPNSELTGNTIFVLSEVYETPAGVAEHWRQAIETWQDLPAFMDWSRSGSESRSASRASPRGCGRRRIGKRTGRPGLPGPEPEPGHRLVRQESRAGSTAIAFA